ncbi:MAG: hypothetical protein QW587_04675 [Candidatus Bathyarchaeia archaeon]
MRDEKQAELERLSQEAYERYRELNRKAYDAFLAWRRIVNEIDELKRRQRQAKRGVNLKSGQ